MKIKCKSCKEAKARIDSGTRDTQGKPIFLDECGKRWNGQQCNSCKNNTKKEVKELSNRHCSQCKTVLPKSRYFTCHICQPTLEDDIGDWEYI